MYRFIFESRGCSSMLEKPKTPIFRKMKIEPQESYFVDDSPANIEAGIRLGMRGCVYHQDMPELRRNLREAGIDLKDA